METNQIQWGIIGCGDVAEVKSGPAFQKCNNSQLVAVMRRNGELAKDFAQRHNVSIWYDNANDLLNDNDINAVYIATPPASHLEYAIKALEAGKDVYLEKPMVLNTDEAHQLKGAVNASKNKLVVAHYRRFLPIYQKIKNLLDDGVIGKVRLADIRFLQPHNFNDKATWRLNEEISGGGYFHDIAPHQIDLMYYFFGDVQSVKGFGVNQANIHKVDDTVNGIINFNSGVQFRGIWSFTMPAYAQEDSCTIFGDKGSIRFSFYEEELVLNIDGKETIFNFENPVNIQQPTIQEVVGYFLEKRDNPCSVQDGQVVTTIMEEFTKK